MKSELRRLERKLFLKIAGVCFMSLFAFILLKLLLVDALLESPSVGGLSGMFQSILGLDYISAEALYARIFASYKGYFAVAGFLLVFLLCFYLCRRAFSRDFARISAGLDAALTGGGGSISLPDELDFAEKRLHAIEARIEKKERDAKAAEQRKNDLIVYLAHDIKTPLTSIIGYLNLLSETRDLPDEQMARYVDLTLEKSYRLEHLIDEFFDITRFNLQTIVLNRQDIDLRRMLDQLADEFYPGLAQSGKSIAIHAPESMRINADADKLARVFNNILKNAMSYSYPDTQIEISAAVTDGRAVISFVNKGDLIPHESLGTIFEKFYRLDTARGSDTGNAGLGLAIAKEIAIAHGGDITAKSDAEQTVFTVSIPVAV